MGPEPLLSQQAPRWCPGCWALDLTLSTEDLELQSQIFVLESFTPHTVCRSQVPHWGHSDGQVVYDFKTNVNQNLKLLGIKGHSQQSAKATYGMDENMCKLYIWKELISRIHKGTSTNTHTQIWFKNGERLEQTFLQRRCTNGQSTRKRCSTSLITMETQLKTTVWYHLAPVSKATK